jgi:hypothetical protein
MQQELEQAIGPKGGRSRIERGRTEANARNDKPNSHHISTKAAGRNPIVSTLRQNASMGRIMAGTTRAPFSASAIEGASAEPALRFER